MTMIAVLRALLAPTPEPAPVQAPMTSVFTHTERPTVHDTTVDPASLPTLEVTEAELLEAKASLRTEGHWIALSTPAYVEGPEGRRVPGYRLSIVIGGLHA